MPTPNKTLPTVAKILRAAAALLHSEGTRPIPGHRSKVFIQTPRMMADLVSGTLAT